MRIGLFAVATAAFAGLCAADKMVWYNGLTCSGEPLQTNELP
jgi:hypothetical protein